MLQMLPNAPMCIALQNLAVHNVHFVHGNAPFNAEECNAAGNHYQTVLSDSAHAAALNPPSSEQLNSAAYQNMYIINCVHCILWHHHPGVVYQ